MSSIFRRFVETGKGEPEAAPVQPVAAKPKPYYQIGQQIGKGSFAEVRMIKPKTPQEDDQKLAVKIIQKAESVSTNKVIIREVKALRKLVHPNIISFHEVLRKGDKFYIIMEFAEGGDLFQKLDKHGAISDDEGKAIFSGIINGLHYCHQLSIAHRDLKLENILLDKNSRPKISDFGFSRSCLDNEGKRILSKTFCGSLYYAGPEILMGSPYNPTISDIWSCGVILYAMMFNAMPFMEKDVKVLVQKELNRDITFPASKGVRESCVELIKWMLEPDVIRRATTSRIIVTSDWLKTVV